MTKKQDVIDLFLTQLRDLRQEMYSADRTKDGDAINWALSHVEERLKEIEFGKRFDVDKHTKDWLGYIPQELPSQMRLWLCSYVYRAADKKMYGLNSITERQEFVDEKLKELGVA